MTLELKDICGYLPYGLMQKHYNDVCSFTIATQSCMGKDVFHEMPIRFGRPILRPMSDLTEEITHRGEKFVPLIKLAKISHPNIPVYAWRNPRHHTINGSRIWRIDAWNDGNHIVVSVTDDVCVPLLCRDLLDRLMFDYRGLISAGLAIDVNTLPENPYEL